MKQNTWEKLEVSTLMLISMVIQALLAFLAPLRKSNANGYLLGFLWLLYLCADSVALLVIGLISRSPQIDNDSRADIIAFWAPFLLLHLGGPDTITALALEDNELWHRHALQLVSQTAVTIYVFGLSIVRGRHNRLWIPMTLMFIDGFIKYAERTWALYLASKEGIRANLGEEPTSSINKWADEYYSAETSYIPSRFEVSYVGSDGDDLDHKENNEADTEEVVDSDHNEEIVNDNVSHASDHSNEEIVSHNVSQASDPNKANTEESGSDHRKVNNEEIVKYAYKLYDNFKCILADDVFNLKDDHKLVENLFLKEDTLIIGVKIIAAELNLIYDILHTKVYLVNKKRSLLRLVCFFSLIAASLLFFLDIHRCERHYKPVDVGVSFILLGGAILLDVVSFLRFIHSDWFIIKLTNLMPSNPSTRANRLLEFFLSFLLKWSARCRTHHDAKRWCQSTSSYNLLSCSFRWKAFNKFLMLIYIKRIKDSLIDWFYVKKVVIDEDPDLKFIFGVLQKKAMLVRGDKAGVEEVCSARGNLVLEEEYCLVSEYLRPWTTDVEDYSESLLTWHLATDICYWVESPDYRKQKREPDYCGLSKQLSDYMVYIILRRQDLVPQLVRKSDVQFIRTEEDIIGAHSKVISSSDKNARGNTMELFCDYVVRYKLDDRIAAQISKSNDSLSVFDEACCLAKQLMMFGDKKWEIISKVWVEMLCYAAIRSSPRYNFASLSKGGELITLVWLFMSHLGFRLPLPENKGVRSAKLIINK